MPLVLENDDDLTRRYMLEELDRDLAMGVLYLSPRLTSIGRERYPGLLREAFATGGITSLQSSLDQPGIVKSHEQSRSRTGTPYTKRIPRTASQTLAEGKFNRFYIRALCARVVDDGGEEVMIYRAGASARPRPESEAKVRSLVNARELLDDLRRNVGSEPTILPEVNSGLSVRLV